MKHPVFLVASFAFALVLTLLGFMAPASVLVDIITEWKLSNAEAGWVGGALFAGYIATVPFLTAYTDRIDPKRIYLCSAAIGALGNFGVALVADGLWSCVLFRVLTGIGLAGTFMPGLKALSDQLPEGKVQQRGSTYYSSFFALGSGLSILVAGVAAEFLDWRWAFIIAGIGGLGAFSIVWVVLPWKVPQISNMGAGAALDFRPVLRDRAVMPYVYAGLGNAWEVFISRVWLVTFFVFLQSRLPSDEIGWSAHVWSTIVALVGVPVAMVVGELSVRYSRQKILMWISLLSCCLSVLVGFSVFIPYELGLFICVIFGMFSYGRSAATTAGAVAAAEPRRRGSALAVVAFVGFSGGVLGPLAYGIALDFLGGTALEVAWIVAMCVMAIGPLITFASMLRPATGSRADH